MDCAWKYDTEYQAQIQDTAAQAETCVKMVLVSGIISNTSLLVTSKMQELHVAVTCCDSAFDSNLAYVGRKHKLLSSNWWIGEFCSYYVCCGHENKGEVKYHMDWNTSSL